jgi:hypothetical protein
MMAMQDVQKSQQLAILPESPYISVFPPDFY